MTVLTGVCSLVRMAYNICMATVIKISKEGFDVEKETDPKNFIFDSTYNHLKTAGSGSFSETLNDSSNTTKTIAHGLSYRPLAMAFWSDDVDNVTRITNSNPENSVGRQGTNSEVVLYCDATNVYFKIFNDSGQQATFTVQYEYFYEGDA